MKVAASQGRSDVSTRTSMRLRPRLRSTTRQHRSSPGCTGPRFRAGSCGGDAGSRDDSKRVRAEGSVVQ